jgi:recombination protein RecT
MAENNLAQQPKTGLQKFNGFMENPRTQEYLQSVLNERKGLFVTNMVSLVANNKTLQECQPATIMYAGIKAVGLNLTLDSNLGYCYVIPFKDNKTNTTVATFQVGVKGLVQLAMRSGQFKSLNVGDVREGEIIEEDFLSGEFKFKKLSVNRSKAKLVGFFAYMKLINGFEKTLYMTIDELKAHGLRYSQTYKRGFGLWRDDFEKMCEKTVLKQLLNRYAPLSIEMETAMKADQAVITENGEQYIDNDKNGEPTPSEEYTNFEEVQETVDTDTGEIKEDVQEQPKDEEF